MLKTNFHTHTQYCDGKNTIEEMILAAIERNFDIIGFSSHSAYPFASDWHVAPQNLSAYINEVRSLAKVYSDKITVLCGFEADYLPPLTKPSLSKEYALLAPDYLIGSVHYLMNEKGFFTVDESAEGVLDGIKRLYNSDARAAVCDYFSAERKMLFNCDFTIWGHPDLFRRRNSVLHLFDERESWYQEELRLTAKSAANTGIIAEINTGGMARGCTTTPYPSQEFLSLLHDEKVPITFSSDAHTSDTIDFAFDHALKAALQAGYTECAYIDAEKHIRFQKIF